MQVGVDAKVDYAFKRLFGMKKNRALAIDLFELPKFHQTAEKLTSELERWLFLVRHGEQLDQTALPNTLQVLPLFASPLADELEREALSR